VLGFLGDAIGTVVKAFTGSKGSRTGGKGSSGLLGVLGQVADFLKGPLKVAFAIIGGVLDGFAKLIHTTLGHISDAVGALRHLIGLLQTAISALTHLDKIGGNTVPTPNPAGFGVPHAAGGWVGLHGPEIGLLGEKGPEYILSNDQLRSGGGGGMSGGGSSTTINFTYAPATSTASAAEAQQFSRAVMPEFIREARRQKLIA